MRHQVDLEDYKSSYISSTLASSSADYKTLKAKVCFYNEQVVYVIDYVCALTKLRKTEDFNSLAAAICFYNSL